MDDRKPIFYHKLKQANEDILSLVRGSLERSSYFDFSDPFSDYIKLIEKLKQEYPLGPQEEQTVNKSEGTNDVSSATKTNSTTTNINGQSLSNNSPASTTATTTIFNATSSNNTSSMPNEHDSGNNGDEPEGDEEDAPPQTSLDTYEEPDYKYKTRSKLYEVDLVSGSQPKLLGCGNLYVKDTGTPTKLHIVFRKDPDFRQIILNKLIMEMTPVAPLKKAVSIILPIKDGLELKHKRFIAKVKDEQAATELYNLLHSVKNV